LYKLENFNGETNLVNALMRTQRLSCIMRYGCFIFVPPDFPALYTTGRAFTNIVNQANYKTFG